MKTLYTAALLVWLAGSPTIFSQETLAPLQDGTIPQTHAELWAGFDPRAEPLDVEVLKAWEEDGVVLKVLRYRIGVFKGQKAMMAGVYGYPKGGSKLPGLVNIHGGGQYADYRAVLTNAKRGYATITISWAGRIAAPDYHVSPHEVKLFWDNKTDDPRYKVTTDWGALDAYHAPSKNGRDAFTSFPTAPWTLDPVESPRNNSWFLCTVGARRALTFLERQPEVDAEKLGVYGHSMGGKLTVLTTGADARVKAAAPSCGGISDRYNDRALHRNTVGDSPSLKQISCPTIILSPANDFHGHINDLIVATEELQTKDWRVTCSAHLSHKDLPENEVATQLWFDEHLKGTFTWPETPTASLHLDTPTGIPSFSVTPDASKPIVAVDVFYCQQGIEGGDRQIRLNRINRFWHAARATEKEGVWTANLPLFDTQKPLWVYANVVYALEKPVTAAGYYYGTYTADTFNLSSLLQIARPEELQAAGVRPTLRPTRMIETFGPAWDKEWFTTQPADWARQTHKLYHPMWAAPEGAKLALHVRAEKANTFVVGIDAFAAEVKVAGGSDWKPIVLSPSDFKNVSGTALSDWSGAKELRLVAVEHLRADKGKPPRRVGAPWVGPPPQFRNLRWVAPIKPLLKKGDRVAIVGDSITEQKQYSKFIELYLLACVPEMELSTFQFGWGGEKAPGFARRMEKDLVPWKPTVVTTCFGMNDGLYRPFTKKIGETYEEGTRRIQARCKDLGARMVVGGPGAVDTELWRMGEPEADLFYNQNLALLSGIAGRLASSNGFVFAELHPLMMDVMRRAKYDRGKSFPVCGRDGVHPGPNGHLVMAYAFLQAMGLDGSIGTVTVDMTGGTTATEGHRVISSDTGTVELESTRYPFCFYGEEADPNSPRSILPFLPFNQRLNRYLLVVRNLAGPAGEVTWGGTTKTFSKAELQSGVNLAAAFSDNPFSAPFQALERIVNHKQARETRLVKGLSGLMVDCADDPEALDALTMVQGKLMDRNARQADQAREAVKAVKHTLRVVPVDSLPSTAERAAEAGDNPMRIMFRRMDRNADDQVTREEYIGMFVEFFTAQDKDGDGTINEAEFGHPAFKSMDADQDGKATLAEFKGLYSRQFDGLDANGNGRISLDEI